MPEENILNLDKFYSDLELIKTFKETDYKTRLDFLRTVLKNSKTIYTPTPNTTRIIPNSNKYAQVKANHLRSSIGVDIPILKYKIDCFLKSKSIVFDLPEVLGILDAMITKLESKES